MDLFVQLTKRAAIAMAAPKMQAGAIHHAGTIWACSSLEDEWAAALAVESVEVWVLVLTLPAFSTLPTPAWATSVLRLNV